MITKDEWVNWRQSSVTQEYLKALVQKREELKEGLAEGQSGSEREDCTVMGRCIGLKEALDYAISTFDYFQLEDNNGSEGNSVSGDFEG